MAQKHTKNQFVICIRNDDYPASLEPRKIYRVANDPDAATLNLLRIIDESGEDYLYPAEYFIVIKLPQPAEKIFDIVT